MRAPILKHEEAWVRGERKIQKASSGHLRDPDAHANSCCSGREDHDDARWATAAFREVGGDAFVACASALGYPWFVARVVVVGGKG